MTKEKFNPINAEEEKSEEDILESAAEEAGLNMIPNFKLPKTGSQAHEKLRNACIEYAKAVAYENKSSLYIVDEERKKASQKRRRVLHNELCVKIAGTPWNETPKEKRDAISNFAVIVGGEDDYVGTSF